MKYETRQDLIDYWVKPALGDFADYFDAYGISLEVGCWIDGKLVVRPEFDATSDDFDPKAWELVLLRHQGGPKLWSRYFDSGSDTT